MITLRQIRLFSKNIHQQTKMPADDERFGARAAVAPRQVICEHERQ